MKITVICSTSRTKLSSTYNLAKKAVEELKGEDEAKYFFLPKDFSHFCSGCMQCIYGFPERCVGYKDLKPIRDSMNESDLIIFAVPVYVYHAPGQLKAFLDHFAWEWMLHHANELMFKKQVLVISTAAGAGMKSTIKDVKDSLDYWGVGRVYTYKKAVNAANWSDISLEKREKMLEEVSFIANKIERDSRNLTPRLKAKSMFWIWRFIHKYKHFNEADVKYWKQKGWLDKKRPWK